LRSVADRGIGYQRSEPVHIVIHPGSGSSRKCWPAIRYAELVERLVAAGRSVRVILGEVELEKWPARQVALFEKIAPVRRPANYLELLAELSSAAVYIGNDSGPGHLAG